MRNDMDIQQNDNEHVRIDNNLVSFKLVQSIYNEITGKKETTTKRLKDAHEIKIVDLEQLNIKIKQLHEQYNIISSNCSVNIFHIDDCKEQFSSFERFKLYDSSSMSPCENILLEYNFLILLPSTQTTQSYSIKINLVSRVGVNKKSQSEHGFSRRFFGVMGKITGMIEIEYIDYTVARNFMVAIEDWYSSVTKNKTSKLIEFFQDWSEHFRFIFQATTIFFLVLFFYKHSEEFISSSPSINTLFSGSIVAFGTLYFAVLVAAKMGSISEEAIDSYHPLSFVKINRGDDVAITEFKCSNKKILIKLLQSSVFALAVNIIALYVTDLLGMG